MAFTHSPKIVTDGLIFYIDAANPRSYISGSSSVKNLRDTLTNVGTLTNGVDFSSSPDSWDFDGDDDYIELGSINSSNPLSLYGQTDFSIDLWLKPDYTGDEYQRIIDKSDGTSAQNGWAIAYPRSTTKNFYLFIDQTDVISYDDSAADGNWRNFIVTRSGAETNLYINSILVDTETITKSIPNDTTNMRIGTWNHSNVREYNGKINSIKIYTKELSQDEVNQNYESQKNKFI